MNVSTNQIEIGSEIQDARSASSEMLMASIIIPNYNHGRYLSDAVQSVLNQAYRNFEVIVIDDGSTDNSREVAAQFGNQIRYIWQENQGLSAARNTGIRATTGDLIGLLDADDIYEPHFLSTLVFSLQANPTADGIYCGYRFVDDQNKPLPQIESRSIPSEQLHKALVGGNFLVPESMLVRRHCYEAVGPFDESLRACEDWDIWLKITEQFNIIGTRQVLTRHRILPGSMSSDPIRMLTNRLTVIRQHFGPEPKNAKAGTSTQRQAYGRAYLTTAVEYLQYHDEAQAYECLQKMAVIAPELLTELETFYELGCGDQPKGSRGQFTTLNTLRSTAILLDMLNKLFADPRLPAEAKIHKQQAFVQAYLALGLLNYGARQFKEARQMLLNAAATDPTYLLDRRLMSPLIKSLPGTGVLRQLGLKQQRTVD